MQQARGPWGFGAVWSKKFEKNNKKDAFFEVKKALNLNPEYKPAIELMNKLQNELI